HHGEERAGSYLPGDQTRGKTAPAKPELPNHSGAGDASSRSRAPAAVAGPGRRARALSSDLAPSRRQRTIDPSGSRAAIVNARDVRPRLQRGSEVDPARTRRRTCRPAIRALRGG